MNRHIFVFLLLISIAPSVLAKVLTLAIDLSGSNPLLIHPNFAHIAGQYVHDQITSLKTGDIVRVKSFGSRGDAANLLNQRFVISRRVKPQKIAAAITQYLQTLPGKESTAQGSTNLIAWLEFTHGFDCGNEAEILVLTDGLESSALADAGRLIQGKQKLPKADVDLKGCHLTFYGLGAGLPPQSVKHLRKEWRAWSEGAGAAFTAIIP